MTTKKLLFTVLFLINSICYAQEISADRPGALTGTDVMPLHTLQWETGMGYESTKGGPHTFTLNNTLLRFGLFENTEIRVGTDFLMWNDGQAREPSFGVSPLTIGMKTRFYESTGYLPSVSMLVELKSPHVGTKELLPAHLAPSLHLLFEHTFTDWLGICYNVGAEWDGETATPTTYLGFGVYFDITEHIGTFVETYNYIHPEGNQYLTQFGFTWLASRRVQLDVSADLDFKNLGKFYVVSSGVAWLIN